MDGDAIAQKDISTNDNNHSGLHNQQEPCINVSASSTVELLGENTRGNGIDTPKVCLHKQPPEHISSRNAVSVECKTQEAVEQPVANKKRKFNYLDWDVVKSNRISFGMPLLKNGNVVDPIVLNKRALKLKNTCPFESLMQVLINAISVYEKYKENIKFSPHGPVELALSILEGGKVTHNHYKTRAKMLSTISLFEVVKLTRHMDVLNAKCNSAHLVQFLFRNMPSVSISVHCLKCGHKNARNLSFLSISVDIIFDHGFGKLQEAINDNILPPSTICSKCKKNISI